MEDDSSDSAHEVEEEELFELNEDDVREELAGLREEFEAEVAEDEGFHLQILGGKWTAEHVGKVADRVACFARGHLAFEWCRQYQWPRMTSFAFRKFTQAGAVELAREVTNRSNYCYALWLSSDVPVFRYSEADLEGYLEGLEWINWMLAQEVESVSFSRGMQIRRMLPTNPA